MSWLFQEGFQSDFQVRTFENYFFEFPRHLAADFRCDSRELFREPPQVVSRPDYFEKAVVPHLRTHGKEAMDPVDSAAKAIVKELFPGKTAVFDYGN